MSTEITHITEDEIIFVGAANDPETDYILWTKGIDEKEIYFETNGQAKSGYDIVKEITIDFDGVHIVLNDSTVEHFYFNLVEKEDWKKLATGLQKIYQENKDVIEINT